MGQGYDVTEYEAAWRLTKFRRELDHYRGLAYENISVTGANTGEFLILKCDNVGSDKIDVFITLLHYVPHKDTAVMISRETSYLNTEMEHATLLIQSTSVDRRTNNAKHTPRFCKDIAVFPKGTSRDKLDILAWRALWQDGMNYEHGTGHGIGSYLNIHEGPHRFSSTTPLVPRHVVMNKPGFYKVLQFWRSHDLSPVTSWSQSQSPHHSCLLLTPIWKIQL
ncbi:hypothetical protein K474DRAFT_1712474 [Panus rudis PR-1116 ss-1]|nr:hypothetical protein K474DRAFT_1712474 [Panus rudis PR-1116 ss-1]